MIIADAADAIADAIITPPAAIILLPVHFRIQKSRYLNATPPTPPGAVLSRPCTPHAARERRLLLRVDARAQKDARTPQQPL